MKMYTLDLENYKVGEHEVKPKQEYYDLLRMPGIYSDGLETCDGVILANRILECDDTIVEINETELALLKKVLNILIKIPHNPPATRSLGGPRYDTLIVRVFMLDKE